MQCAKEDCRQFSNKFQNWTKDWDKKYGEMAQIVFEKT